MDVGTQIGLSMGLGFSLALVLFAILCLLVGGVYVILGVLHLLIFGLRTAERIVNAGLYVYVRFIRPKLGKTEPFELHSTWLYRVERIGDE